VLTEDAPEVEVHIYCPKATNFMSVVTIAIPVRQLTGMATIKQTNVEVKQYRRYDNRSISERRKSADAVGVDVV
jgi:hypothetical protein